MDTLYTFVTSQGHEIPDHPEAPGRFGMIDVGTFPAEVLSYSPARMDEISRVHTPRMIEHLELTCQQGPAIIDVAPTYVTASSFRDAINAAGATLALTRAVINGDAKNAFAIVRPPGHHAEPDHPMGFCLFNNVAIAAKDALAQGLERLMVIDYDAHHGNGTERAFWIENRAAYFSTHQEHIYPGTGWLEGAPHAKGRIADFPLEARTGDRDFEMIIEQALIPLVKAFHPELLFVSAGFDAHWRDPLTALGLSTSGYYSISKKLVELADEFCKGKIVFVLEGGYEPESLKNGIAAVFAALARKRPPKIADASPHPEPDVSKRIEDFRKWHEIK